MNRRDFLRQAGVVAVGASAAASTLAEAASGVNNRSSIKDLRVTFDGPFCFWFQGTSVKVMAPPVGLDYKEAPHQPWLGTTTNEMPISVPPGTNLSLKIPGYKPGTDYKSAGTPAFECNQGTGDGVLPLFNLIVPTPYAVIGVRPTAAKINCVPGVKESYCKEYCNQWKIFASGLTFVYPIVDLDGVAVKNGALPLFTPCFTNDDSLPDATLGVYLSPLCLPDPDHTHATDVWGQMVAMYPWIAQETTGIDFCANYNAASCNFDPTTCVSAPKHQGLPQFGPGSDCQVPIMNLTPGSGGSKRHK